jgi:hypothetical protein
MFSISWTEADGVVTERRETVASAVALMDEAVTRRRADVTIIDDRDQRSVSIKQLHQIAGTEMIGQRVYQSRAGLRKAKSASASRHDGREAPWSQPARFGAI